MQGFLIPMAKIGQPPFLRDFSLYSNFPIHVVLAPYFGIIGLQFSSVISLKMSFNSFDLVTMIPTSIKPQSK